MSKQRNSCIKVKLGATEKVSELLRGNKEELDYRSMGVLKTAASKTSQL